MTEGKVATCTSLQPSRLRPHYRAEQGAPERRCRCRQAEAMVLRIVTFLATERSADAGPESLKRVDRRYPFHVEARAGERTLQARPIVEAPVSSLDHARPAEGTVRSDEEASPRAKDAMELTEGGGLLLDGQVLQDVS